MTPCTPSGSMSCDGKGEAEGLLAGSAVPVEEAPGPEPEPAGPAFAAVVGPVVGTGADTGLGRPP